MQHAPLSSFQKETSYVKLYKEGRPLITSMSPCMKKLKKKKMFAHSHTEFSFTKEESQDGKSKVWLCLSEFCS